MPEKQLRESLEELQRTLEAQRSVDVESRALLSELADDIQELLEREPEEREAIWSPLVDRATEAMRRFEKSHPALTEVIGRVATALSNLGI